MSIFTCLPIFMKHLGLAYIDLVYQFYTGIFQTSSCLSSTQTLTRGQLLNNNRNRKANPKPNQVTSDLTQYSLLIHN